MRTKTIEDTTLVVIGMPVFNGEKYVQRALDSLLAQTFTDFELIISDNSSTDNTWIILRDYANKDKRIILFRQPINYGALDNFRFVLDKARGKYFMWAACDDFWMPDFVGKMVKELEAHPEAAVAMSAVERIRETDERHDVVRHTELRDPGRMSHFKLSLALAGGRLYHLFIYGLYRTDLLKKAFRGFPAVAAGDRLFMCQIALSGGFRYVDEVLHVRTMSSEPIVRRYANEALGQAWRHPLAGLKTSLAMGPYLFRSQVIPSTRKLLIPLLVMRFICRTVHLLLRETIRLAAGLVFGPERAKGLAQYVRRMLRIKPV